MTVIPVLTIAGSDCSGGAGVQADIKTLSALGCYAASAITAVTVQNTLGVESSWPVPSHVVGAQIRAVMEDIKPVAVKVGMLVCAATVEAVCRELRQSSARWVVADPVILSSSGYELLDDAGVEALVRELLPLTGLLTPNLPEAERLTGIRIRSEADCRRAAAALLDMGCRAVLIKGGHAGSRSMTDRLYMAADGQTETYEFTAAAVSTRNTHGTGCTLSSAIAAYLARGLDLPEAVARAKSYLTAALRASADIEIGAGTGPCALRAVDELTS